MKKPHPCGSDLWAITRVGMDFGLKCRGCGHFVMMPRPKFEKMARSVVEKASPPKTDENSGEKEEKE